MSFLKYINPYAFISSFIIGLYLVYWISPSKNKVYVYPTPDNAGQIEYVDDVGNCFEFKATRLKECPHEEDREHPIKHIPPSIYQEVLE
jgi:hypothetical protein